MYKNMTNIEVKVQNFEWKKDAGTTVIARKNNLS